MKQKLLASLETHRQNVAQLFEELEKLPAEKLNRKPTDGGWSAIQTMQHLILAEESALKYVRKKMSFESRFEQAGVGSWWRFLKLRILNNLPVKLKAPAVVGSEEVLDNSASLDAVKTRWMQNFAAWADFFKNLPANLERAVIFKHPFAGRLSFWDMIGFFGGHFSRHLRQIWRAVA